MNKIRDLTGNKYGRLAVIELSHTKHGNSYWLCECQCGSKIIVSAPHLKTGHTQSCGCLQKQLVANRSTKHNLSNSRLYRIWAAMKQRCTNTNNQDYAYYGGRGIFVCDEWLDFEGFNQWAIVAGYTEELTLDRINTNKGYSSNNCRWATMKEQQNNRRNNLPVVLVNGKALTITEWAENTGLTYGAIHGRLYLLGKTAEAAISN